MIYVDKKGKHAFSVKLKRPVPIHIDRIKTISGARFVNKDVGWILPMNAFEDFEDLFWDELIYITPRHRLLGTNPPKAPKFYQEIGVDPIKGLKLPLYRFQNFGARYLAYAAKRFGFGILGDKMGIGKSPQSIAGAMLLVQEKLVKRVLVVCPASLRKQWVKEAVNKFTDEIAYAVIGDAKQRKDLYDLSLKTNARFTIVSYESLLHDMDFLMKGKFDLIIFDEAHKLKNKMGKMNRAAERLMKPVKSKKYPGIPYAFFLTGTPLMNRIEEIYGLFKLKDRGIFGTFDDFLEDFTRFNYLDKKKTKKEIIGYRNLSELRRIMKWYMLRRTEEEVKMDLPKQVETWHYSDMNPLQKKLEKLANEDDGDDKAKHGIRQAIANCPELLTMTTSKKILQRYGAVVEKVKNKRSPKLDDMLEMIDEIFENYDKVVIFTQFKRMVKIIMRELGKAGIKAVRYDGDMDDEERDNAVNAFRDDSDITCFVATDAANAGLNLQCARYLINFDLPWNPAIWNQRKGRIRRIGSTHDSVTIINMATENSIDMEKKELLVDKQNLFDATIENDEGQTRELRKLLN